MAYTGAGYDPETLDLMTKAFTAGWREALGQGVPTDQHEAIQFRMASVICGAVDAGERDPERLKERGPLCEVSDIPRATAPTP